MMKQYLKNNYKSIIIKILLVAVILAIDLLTKSFCSRLGEDRTLIKGVLSIKYTENTGAAFSMFSDKTIWLTVFSAVFVIALILFDIKLGKGNFWSFAGFSLIVSGAIGNLVDRLFLGYVRDFISFDFLKNFAICNIADVCITIGCICYIVYIIFYLGKTKEE